MGEISSENFGFLKARDPDLQRLGALAERFFREDPNTALIKTRQFAELLAGQVAALTNQIPVGQATQFDLLKQLSRSGVISKEVADVFHMIRKRGNEANHDFSGTHEQALSSIKFALILGVWYHRRFRDGSFKPPVFRPPPEPGQATAELQKKLSELEEQLKHSLSAAEIAEKAAADERDKRLSAEEKAALAAEEFESRRVAEQAVEAAEATQIQRLETIQHEHGTSTPPPEVPLEMDETDTRDLIDSQLRAAGWVVDSRNLRFFKGTRPDPTKAMAIAEWPTTSGPVDYALFVDGKCIGVIEAKRQSKDVPGVLAQAKRYASDITLNPDQLIEGESYQHWLAAYQVPFCLATNGRPYVKQYPEKSGIWFWDAREETNHAHALPEWFSPDDLKAKLERETAKSYGGLREEPFDYGNLRPYQQEAIEAVEGAIQKNQRDILVAMATGTGKTRTCIALMYRLLKHKRFRRILFLVDRKALAEQTVEALENTELEGLLKFSQTYNVAGLDKKVPDREDRVQVATVQSLVKRIIYDEGDTRITPGMYDCIVVDEAHRGYTLDAELREEDISFRNTDDYLSKYRRVLDFFDATKVALTATPALHTREIFGHPVYRYSYRQAVIDGYLIDHQPPKRIVTALNTAGITFNGGEQVEIIDPKTGQIDLFDLPDEVPLEFDVAEFNKKVHTREFNRVVCETIAAEISPDKQGKCLIFASRDDHADLIVEELKKALEEEHGPIADDLVQKITGTVDRTSDKIRSFRNNDRPKYVVTVDLLTTGVDIPKITDLVFVRRVNSRILYDQMIGRATRKCDEIGKEYFRIFDAVDIYANLQEVTDMRPVVANPNISFAQLATDLTEAETPVDKAFVKDQIIVRMRHRTRRMTDQTRETFKILTGKTPEEFTSWLHGAQPDEIEEFFNEKPRVLEVLDTRESRSYDPMQTGQALSSHEDELIGIEEIFGDNLTPEDYIEAFERYVRENMNSLPAMIAATQRPKELTRNDLKALASALDEEGFSSTNLRAAYGKARNADIAAHIIGFVRQAALGDPLVPYTTRVDNAVAKIEASRNWSAKQKQWLRRIGRALKETPVGDPALMDEGAFRQKGGFAEIDKEFGNQLQGVLEDFNDAIWNAAS